MRSFHVFALGVLSAGLVLGCADDEDLGYGPEIFEDATKYMTATGANRKELYLYSLTNSIPERVYLRANVKPDPYYKNSSG